MKNTVVMIVFIFWTNAICQSNQIDFSPKDSLLNHYQDTALYDIYGMDYKFSQLIKYSIRYGSVGGATGLAISTGYILYNNIQDGTNIGILSTAGAITGVSTGYISGLIYGFIKGSSDKKQKVNNPQFYHKMDHIGYSFGGSGSPNYYGRLGSLYSISIRNIYKRAYFPERIYLTFENMDWQGNNFEDEHFSYSNSANEYRFGTNLRYYIKDRSIFNYYYEFGLGYTTGNYWEFNSNLFGNKSKRTFSFIYTDIIIGVEINIFDFFYGDLSMLLEPIGPLFVIQNSHFSTLNIFMLRATVGTYIF